MARILSYQAITLLIVFTLYALWLIARGTNPMRADAWATAPMVVLIAFATVATIIGIVFFGRFESAPAGSAYEPARMEGGKLVPPRVEPPANPK